MWRIKVQTHEKLARPSPYSYGSKELAKTSYGSGPNVSVVNEFEYKCLPKIDPCVQNLATTASLSCVTAA